jgi:hypothetical protein
LLAPRPDHLISLTYFSVTNSTGGCVERGDRGYWFKEA